MSMEDTLERLLERTTTAEMDAVLSRYGEQASAFYNFVSGLRATYPHPPITVIQAGLGQDIAAFIHAVVGTASAWPVDAVVVCQHNMFLFLLAAPGYTCPEFGILFEQWKEHAGVKGPRRAGGVA